jgi:hypothetical protein
MIGDRRAYDHNSGHAPDARPLHLFHLARLVRVEVTAGAVAPRRPQSDNPIYTSMDRSKPAEDPATTSRRPERVLRTGCAAACRSKSTRVHAAHPSPGTPRGTGNSDRHPGRGRERQARAERPAGAQGDGNR